MPMPRKPMHRKSMFQKTINSIVILSLSLFPKQLVELGSEIVSMVLFGLIIFGQLHVCLSLAMSVKWEQFCLNQEVGRWFGVLHLFFQRDKLICKHKVYSFDEFLYTCCFLWLVYGNSIWGNPSYLTTCPFGPRIQALDPCMPPLTFRKVV